MSDKFKRKVSERINNGLCASCGCNPCQCRTNCRTENIKWTPNSNKIIKRLTPKLKVELANKRREKLDEEYLEESNP
jgi:hypothetical protein